MEFTCSRCGLTYCGILIGTTPICEDCFNELHNELMEDKEMVKLKYNMIGECIDCEACTSIDVETNLCEGCMDKGMTFTEAIQKYSMITNDGGKTVYKVNKEGTIFRKAKGCGGAFSVTVDLLTSTGWEEYRDKELVLPKAVNCGLSYITITSTGSLVEDSQVNDFVDEDRLETFNYFTNKKFAQYVADKQLIQRIELTLIELNKDEFPKEELTKLINKYLRDNHMKVLDRIIQHEL